MPSEEEITPEEKLLRVIQGDGAQEPAGAVATAPERGVASSAPDEPMLAVTAESEPGRQDPEAAASGAAGQGEENAELLPSEPTEAAADVAAGEVPAPEDAPVPEEAVAASSPSFLSVLKSGFSGAFEWGPRSGGLSLPAVNHYLGVLAPALALFVLYDVYRLSADQPDVIGVVQRMGGKFVPRRAGGGPSALAPLADYVQTVRRRSIFEPVSAARAPERPAPVGAPAWQVYVRKNLSLLGLAWNAEEPESSEAIVKDAAANTVFFLKQGQRVGQQAIAVKRVFRDRIILESDGQETELR